MLGEALSARALSSVQAAQQPCAALLETKEPQAESFSELHRLDWLEPALVWSLATAQHGPGWGLSFILSLVNSWITLSRGLPDDSQWGHLEAAAGRGGCVQGQEGLHLGGGGDEEEDLFFNTPRDTG